MLEALWGERKYPQQRDETEVLVGESIGVELSGEIRGDMPTVSFEHSFSGPRRPASLEFKNNEVEIANASVALLFQNEQAKFGKLESMLVPFNALAAGGSSARNTQTRESTPRATFRCLPWV